MEGSFSNPGYFTFDLIEEGRREIFKWSEKRRSKRAGLQGTLYKVTKLFITRSLVRSFMHNLSIVVAFQMLLAGLCTYSCVKLGLEMDVHMSLFVSPIVFPLAFSINANYQRRESVLEDLALFKSSSSILFFCHRDWIKAAELPLDLLKTLSNKLKFLVINIREYLLTEDSQKRKFILQAIYEDLSDIAQLNDKIRTSPLKSNSALIARIIHCHTLMCWAFERLRVIREYNSPRSLRAFTKVFIFLMPLLLSPYYVFSGRQTESSWTPYYISVMVSFLFGSLQSVQDKLDDPFDGIGEDDVKLGQLDDWTTQSLLTNRTVTIGRFTVTTTTAQEEQSRNTTPVPPVQPCSNDEISPKASPKKSRRFNFYPEGSPGRLRRILSRKSERNAEGRRSAVTGLDENEFTDQLESRCHGIASRLEGLSGTSIILPGNRVPYVFHEYQGIKSPEPNLLPSASQKAGNSLTVADSNKEKNISGFHPRNRLAVVRESDEETSDAPSSPEGLPISEKLLFSMKSDAVVRPDDSSQKRPTVLGLFASPESNTDNKVSDSVFTNPEVSSPPTNGLTSRSGAEISADTSEVSPSSNSSEDLPLLPVNNRPVLADESENDSEIETLTVSPEATTDTGGTLDGTKGDTSERGGVPKLRFCLPGKRGARGDRVRMWGRKHKKKRSPQQKSVKLTATNSMSPLLQHGASQCSDIEEQPRVFDSKDSDKTVDIGTEEHRHSRHQPEDFEPTDQMTSEINQTDTQLSETNSSDAHPINNIAKNPQIVVISPVEEETSLWDFDLSSDQPHDNNIVKDSSLTTEDFTSSKDPNIKSSMSSSVTGSSPSILDIPSSENNIFAEPSEHPRSAASNDSENIRNPKPKRSRFTVSAS